MKQIYFLTNYLDIIPQREKEVKGLKLDVITDVLQKQNFQIIKIDIASFASVLKNIDNFQKTFFFYASSQYPIYKSYIHDVMYQINLLGGILIPNFNLLIAHENKNFQELEKKRLKISSPKSEIIGCYEEGISILKNETFPVVLKKSTGFGSKDVKVAKNFTQAKKILFKLLEKNFQFDYESLVVLYRRFQNKNSYPKRFGKVVIQQFIPALKYDWKILVFGSKFFCLKRFVKKNDFKASGSGLFSFDEKPPISILNFALDCKNKLDTPLVSLDIVEHENKPLLIEYQSNHFGLLTAMNAKFYYEKINNKWTKSVKTNAPEHYIGLSLIEYMNNYS